MAVYGKVTESQAKMQASKAVTGPQNDVAGRVIETAPHGDAKDVADSVLEGFEKTRAARR